MPVTNTDVARIFNQVADLLELQDDNPFRIRSYRNAARTLRSLSTNVRDMVGEGEDLTELPGIGEDLAGKIKRIVETGKLPLLEELKEEVPLELTDLMKIEGLGPKRVRSLWEELGITTPEELREAAEEGRVRGISGFGEKTEQNILDHLEEASREEVRTLLMEAEQIAEPVVDYLEAHDAVGRVEVAGSYRRRRETVGDLDVLVVGEDGEDIGEYVTDYEDVEEVLSRGETKTSVVLASGMQVDVRVVAGDSYGAALLYFTGSKEHNIALRNIGVDAGFKINEYGVFNTEGEREAGETEEGIYEFFDCAYVVPELRENRGEIEAAREGTLPDLVTPGDVVGDLQSHTTSSDGSNSLEEMAEAARDRGHEYLAITDHSRYIGITTGLDEEGLLEQVEVIDELNEQYDDFRVLKSCEVDVDREGALTLPGEVLGELDLVLVAVHSNFDLPEAEQTDRVVNALQNPHSDILAHPTTRLIGGRPPLDLDLDAVMDAALDAGSYLEINAQPDRLDLSDVHAKKAHEKGLKLAISTDAHAARNLDYMRFGVNQARRGWLEADDVLNTRPWSELVDYFSRE